MKKLLLLLIASLLPLTLMAECPDGSVLRLRGRRVDTKLPPLYFEIGKPLIGYEYADNSKPDLDLQCSTSKFKGEGENRYARAVVVTCTGKSGASIAIPIKYSDVIGGSSLPIFLKDKNGATIKLTAGCFAASS